MTTPNPIDPFTAELLTRLAQGAFRPPAPMPPPGLMQPPVEPRSGLGGLMGLLGGMTMPRRRPQDPYCGFSDFLAGAPSGFSPEQWRFLMGGS